MSDSTITRKSLLYLSKVEYGGWTVNHVLGCAHGCRYPCYAMTLARRTGRIAGYDEWVQPKVVANALELLEVELYKFSGEIDMVHLCFTTDPFMYDRDGQQPIRDVASMSINIIRRLNKEGIPVTTLTKGVYPEEFVQAVADLDPSNQYGISLVSLSESYRRQWEPRAASATQRIASLKSLSTAGARTWVSAEPYPTPNIDETASDAITLLDAVGFVDKIVFGKWNYNSQVTSYERETGFYAGVACQVVDWCSKNGKTLHIKSGTPLSVSSSSNFLKNDATIASDNKCFQLTAMPHCR